MRNRESLLRAARGVFERDGFVHARITDIAAEAGLATGSFYSHFADKTEALTAVLEEVQEEMLHPVSIHPEGERDATAAIHAANRAYLHAYQRNARLMALLEQVASVDSDFFALRRERTQAFVSRNARGIRRLQSQGVADPSLDADTAALAISSMVSRTAYATFVGRDDETIDVDRLARTLTQLWLGALGMPPNTSTRRRRRHFGL